MGSALLDTAPLDPAFAEASSDSPAAATHAAARTVASPASTEELRRQVAERLAAHRSRRSPAQPALTFTPAPSPPTPARAARIAATVAQRYAHSPSYRAYLAAEAERATQQAQAAAQIAALNAQAVAKAQQQLLDSLHQDSLHREPPGHETPSNTPVDQPQNESPAQLPRELTLWPEFQPSSVAAPRARSAESSRPAAVHPRAHYTHSGSQPFAPAFPGLTVRLFGEAAASPLLGATHRHLAPQLPPSSNSHRNRQEEKRYDAEARLLDEEIAFRQSPIPVFEEPTGPPVPLPANLIEFPRQLVAPRKARPRYAEGPLRAADVPAPGQSQLRIFEVDPAQISTTPIPAEAPAPQWTSIWLDAPGPDTTESAPASSVSSSRSEAEGPAFQPSSRPAPLPQIASIARRLMASAIDTAVLLAAFLAFAAVFLIAAGRSISWHATAALPTASLPLDRHTALARLAAHAAAQFTAHTGLQPSLVLASSALVLGLFFLLYQTLFFSFSEATPGMRCARIALCTFDDENPARRAMRWRILAVLVSAFPLGLGLLWAALDEDRLSWHDRLTRTYQRAY
ncbi:MAG: RDD family protein [Acidobacteriaceae bacterium]